MTRISYITFTYSSTITHYVTRLVVRYVDHSTVSSAVRLERLKVDLVGGVRAVETMWFSWRNRTMRCSPTLLSPAWQFPP